MSDADESGEAAPDDPPDTADQPEIAPTPPASWRHAFVAHGRERRWPLLEPLAERTAQALSQSLRSRFRVDLPVRCEACESSEHAPLVAAMPSDTLYVARTLEPLPGEAWWLIDRALVSGLADRWFGGSGALDGGDRPLSASEQRVLAALVECLDDAM